MILPGIISQQKPIIPIGPNIFVDSISVNAISNELIASYITSGNSEKNQLPVATAVQLTGLYNVGESLDSSWNYSHINNAAEGTTLLTVERADDAGFTTNVVEVAASTPYVCQNSDLNKYLRLGITPVTSDGTQGLRVNSTPQIVGSGIIAHQVAVSFGNATKSFSVTNWNLAHTDNPDGNYVLNNLVRLSDGAVITGLNINVVNAFSDQASGGSTSAGTGGASEFPANSARAYWYPASGTRDFNIEVPGGGLGIGTCKITILSNVTIGTPPHVTSINVNGVNKQIADSSGSTIDDGNILVWDDVDCTTAINVASVDGTGISAINAMIIEYYTT